MKKILTIKEGNTDCYKLLMFNSENLANKFLNNFRDLIEQAKYLI